MSLAKKWLHWRLAIATSMRRHEGPLYDLINAVGDLPIEDDDPSKALPGGAKPPGATEAEATLAPGPAPGRKAATL